ncbi:MAG: NYN domain-containing protein [Acidobacteriaceae bacterium]|nr:NYN domain-containing protein [Acidobacteriaceae bacterium]
MLQTGRQLPKLRVVTYIDGFNLYFGLRENAWQKYMWLDLTALSLSLTNRESQTLLRTKYFTSRISGSKSKEERQSKYLDALTTIPKLNIYYGRFQDDRKTCQKCGHSAFLPQEKKTDVNIATQMLCDAYADAYDVAIVISGDADLVPPIAAVKSQFPNKRVIVAFPPNRFSGELAMTAHNSMHIYESKFRKSRMPMNVTLPSGIIITQPSKWT